MKDISYIIVKEVTGDELPVRIEAFTPGKHDKATWFGAGQDLDSALGAISRFTGRDMGYLRSKIYG
jgi:type IV secretory pathway ATPase VirB11/archaellum biosynthesis ATPase